MDINNIETPEDNQCNEPQKANIVFIIVAAGSLLIAFVLAGAYFFSQGVFDRWFKTADVEDVVETPLTETQVEEKRQSFPVVRPSAADGSATDSETDSAVSLDSGNSGSAAAARGTGSIPDDVPVFEPDPDDPTRKVAEVDTSLPGGSTVSGEVEFTPVLTDDVSLKPFTLPPLEVKEIPGVAVRDTQVESNFTPENLIGTAVEGVVLEFDETQQALLVVVDDVTYMVYLNQSTEYLVDGSPMSSAYIELYDIVAVTGKTVEGEVTIEADRVEIIGVYDPTPF